MLALGWSGSEAAALDPLGVAYVLVAAVFWALYILAGARMGASVPGQGGLAVAMTVAALVMVPSGLAGASVALTSPSLLLLAAGTALLASAIPYTQRRGGRWSSCDHIPVGGPGLRDAMLSAWRTTCGSVTG